MHHILTLQNPIDYFSKLRRAYKFSFIPLAPDNAKKFLYEANYVLTHKDLNIFNLPVINRKLKTFDCLIYYYGNINKNDNKFSLDKKIEHKQVKATLFYITDVYELYHLIWSKAIHSSKRLKRI